MHHGNSGGTKRKHFLPRCVVKNNGAVLLHGGDGERWSGSQSPCFTVPLITVLGKEVCVVGGRWRVGGSPLGRQAGRQACGQDRHTERGKTRDKGVQFTARDELSFTAWRKAFVIRLWAPLTDQQQSGRNENMLFRITLIGFKSPRALCRRMMVYWSPITTQQYCNISICQPAVDFGLVLPRPTPL